MPSETDITRVEQWARERLAGAMYSGGKSYWQGVLDALRWINGEGPAPDRAEA